MSLDAQLSQQLRQIIVVAPSTATANIYGEVGVTTTATVWARIEDDTRDKEQFAGTFRGISTRLIIDAGTYTPMFGDRVWLPSAPSSALKMQRVIDLPDEFGSLEHWECYV